MKRFLWFTIIFAIGCINYSCSKKETQNSSSVLPKTDSTATATLPADAHDGVNFYNSGKSVLFNIYAPKKKTVYVIGDFNNWTKSSAYRLFPTKDSSRWFLQLDNLDPNTEYAYQYLIDDTLRIADPYTEKILDPDNDKYIPPTVYPNLKAYPVGKTTQIVGTFYYNQPAYNWQINNFTRPATSKLVVYELLVRDFVATHSYKTLVDTLDYISRLGVNAIELMPVNEFEGNDSWGYNSNFMFALDKYYGTKNDYKAFIDACHQRGIAVIQDIVLEDQFASSPMVRMYANADGSPSANNPWFYTQNRHPYAVGYQLDHTSPIVKNYVQDVMKYWTSEYHIDGFRFDQSKAFTPTFSATDAAWSTYDPLRVNILQGYYSYLKSLNSSLYLILEHFANNDEQTVLTNAGMLVWTNLNYNANQATMGWNTDWNLSGLFYSVYAYQQPNMVAYFESHDEERLQFKNEQYGNASGNYNVQQLSTGLEREGMAAAFLFASPGPKMIWQFGERGYDVSINDPATGGRLGDKPPHWEYMNNADRLALYHIYAKMIKMKINNDVFNTTNFQYNLGDKIKYIILKGADGTNVLVVGNFDVVAQTVTITLPSSGTWIDNLSNELLTVTNGIANVTLQPGEYHVYANSPLK